MTFSDRTREPILGVPIDALSWQEAIDRILEWAVRQESRAVCICDVHSLVVALRTLTHAAAIASADLVTPDGAPVAWMLRRKGHADQTRISGADLMRACCRRAAQTGIRMFLYGGTPATLRQLDRRLRAEFPGINIVGTYSPPFRALSGEENAEVTDMINRTGAQLVWVGLGCPKQEAWIQAQRGRVQAVMVGVGAAFDFNAGVVKRAPLWMQQNSLEWLHRVLQDPRRLAKRYLVSNSIFVMAVLRQFLWTGTTTLPQEDIGQLKR